jgi:chromosome segregation ATPase
LDEVLTTSPGNLQNQIRDSKAQVKQLQDDKDASQAIIDQLKPENQDLKTKLQDQTWKVKDAEEKQRKAEASTKEKEEARAAAQTELDDLFVVLGDLEEKRTRDKVSAHSPIVVVDMLICCRNDSKNLERKYLT